MLNVVGIMFVMIGFGVFLVDMCDMIWYDVEWLLMVSVVLIVVLLFMLYWLLCMFVFGLLLVLMGVVVGIVVVSIVFGMVYGLMFGFGMMLIGEVVDYLIYLFV